MGVALPDVAPMVATPSGVTPSGVTPLGAMLPVA